MNYAIAGLALLGLAGCASTEAEVAGERVPALEVLALDFERTIVAPGAVISGRVARAQAELGLAISTSGRLRREATGPIPVEVQLDVARMRTSGGNVDMAGTLILRDLGLGTVLATKEDFSGSGPMPAVAPGSRLSGLVFRGVEDEILDWLAGLDCDTAIRTCGPALRPALTGDAVEGDLELASMMVGRRPGTIRQLNTGGIDPGQVVAAAGAPTPAAEPGLRQIGTTTAALGPLDRSGFWLRTPLVSEEAPGEVRTEGGASQAVTLLPSDGPEGGGSQASLALLTALGVDMTALVSLDVFR